MEWGDRGMGVLEKGARWGVIRRGMGEKVLSVRVEEEK